MFDTLAKYCSNYKQPIACEHAQTDGMAKRPINEVLAANLEFFMRERGIESQTELARRSGVAQRTISNYLSPDLRQESKSGKPPSAKLTEIEKIADALDIGAWDLLRDLSPSERAFYANIEDAYAKLTSQPPDAPKEKSGYLLPPDKEDALRQPPIDRRAADRRKS